MFIRSGSQAGSGSAHATSARTAHEEEETATLGPSRPCGVAGGTGGGTGRLEAELFVSGRVVERMCEDIKRPRGGRSGAEADGGGGPAIPKVDSGVTRCVEEREAGRRSDSQKPIRRCSWDQRQHAHQDTRSGTGTDRIRRETSPERKIDLTEAHRQVPIDPRDWHHLRAHSRHPRNCLSLILLVESRHSAGRLAQFFG